MRITSISLRNFMTFGESESRLSRLGSPTVFVGPNGAGKTNVLRGIELAINCLTRPRLDAFAYVYQGRPDRELRVELGVALDDEESSALAAIFEFCSIAGPTSLPKLKIRPEEFLSIVRKAISGPPGLFHDVLRQPTKIVLASRGGDPASTSCRVEFGGLRSSLALTDQGLFNAGVWPLSSWMNVSLVERVAESLERDTPGLLYDPPGAPPTAPGGSPSPLGPFDFRWLRSVLVSTTHGVPTTGLTIPPTSLANPQAQIQGLASDESAFLTMREFLSRRGYDLADVSPMTAFTYLARSSIVHLSDARERPANLMLTRAPVPNPRSPLVTGRELAVELFELKNNPTPSARSRFDELRTGFERLTHGLQFDVVLIGDASQGVVPGSQVSGEQGHPLAPRLFPRIIVRKQSFEFPIELEAAGFIEVLLVLYATVGVTDSVVLLDEPALNLHPTKQRELYAFLKEHAESRHNQLFVVTHSTTFVAPADLVTAVRVMPGDRGSRLRRIRYAKKYERERARKEGLLRPEVLNALFAERVILFEGHDEAAAFPDWFERCPDGELLTTNNVVAINVAGQGNFRPLSRMLRTWAVPYRAIGDGRAKNALKTLGKKARTYPQKDMTTFIEEATPGQLAKYRATYRTRPKDPVNFQIIARTVPPPPAVIKIWEWLKPFVKGEVE